MRIMRTLCLLFVVLASISLIGDETSTGQAPYERDEWSGRTIQTYDEAYSLIQKRFPNAPTVGTRAPDFVLPDAKSGEDTPLSELHAEKPVVLIFGSIGCDFFRDGVSELVRFSREFGDQFEFVMIYVREAHAFGGFREEMGRMRDPATDDERRAAAEACRAATGIPFRILVDSVDDRVATRWAAWPVRLFVVDTKGIVVYAGETGPWGFNPGGAFPRSIPEDMIRHADRFSLISLEEFLRTAKSLTPAE